MAATLASALPVGPHWSYEVKWDGYRALLLKNGTRTKLVSRNLKDLTAVYPHIAAAAARCQCPCCWMVRSWRRRLMPQPKSQCLTAESALSQFEFRAARAAIIPPIIAPSGAHKRPATGAPSSIASSMYPIHPRM